MNETSEDDYLQRNYDRKRIRAKFPVTIICLDCKRLETVFDKETHIVHLLKNVCAALKIENWQYFGFCIPMGKGHKFFLDSDLVKSCVEVQEDNFNYFKSSNKLRQVKSTLLDNTLYVSPVLYLRIRLIMPINCLDLPALRHHYFYQLLENIDKYQMMVDEDMLIKLSAWILQRRFGDFDQKFLNQSEYLQAIDGLPKMVFKSGKLSRKVLIRCIHQMHEYCMGMHRDSAEFQFIKACSLLPYNLNMHLVPLSSHDHPDSSKSLIENLAKKISLIESGFPSPFSSINPNKKVRRAKSLPRQLSTKFRRKLSIMEQASMTKSSLKQAIITRHPTFHDPRIKYWLGIKPEGLQIFQEDENQFLYATASDLKWSSIANIHGNHSKLKIYMNHMSSPAEFVLSTICYQTPSIKSLIQLIKDIRYNYLASQINASQSMYTLELSDYRPFREKCITLQGDSNFASYIYESCKSAETPAIPLRPYRADKS